MNQDRGAICSTKLLFSSVGAVAFSFVVWCGVAIAQVRPEAEYGNYVAKGSTIQPLGDTPFGESINLYDGDISFQQVDVEVPGIGPTIRLPRSFRVRESGKTYESIGMGFYDWNLEIPRIKTITAVHYGGYPNEPHDWYLGGAAGYARCSMFSPPPTLSYANDTSAQSWEPDEWWDGYYLADEGGSQLLLQQAPGEFSTKGNWRIGCLPNTANGQPGEAFLGVAPDGTRYWFNHLVYTYAEPLIKDPRQLDRRYAAMLVTRIEDRFGNWLVYHYNADKLTSISASDGRYVSIAYGNAYSISSITVNTGDTPSRTWVYEGVNRLSAVVNPDGSRWTFALDQLSLAPQIWPSASDCHSDPTIGQPSPISGSITTPSGLTGTFGVELKKHGRSYTDKVCWGNDEFNTYAWYPKLWFSYTLISRVLTGPGLQPQSWSYAYSPANDSWAQDCPSPTSCPSTIWTDVTDPKGTRERHFFSNKFDHTEALGLKTEVYPQGSASPIRTVNNTYAAASPSTSGWPFPWPEYLGEPYTNRANTFVTERWTPLSKREIQQDGVTFAWQANTFDSLARPLSTTRSNTLGYSRTDVTAYHDNTSKWVLGQVASSTNTNTGLVESQIDYDANALPWKTYAFGKLQQTLTYNANGTLASAIDGNNHTTTFAEWKRGIPQKITFADSMFKSAYVNDSGWIEWVKDENGFQTNYGYDAMGRVNLIDYPDGDTVNWNSTAISFAPAAATGYGLPAAHWRRTESTGTARKITYYDAFWRPVLQEVYDTANTWGTITQTITRYDADGRVTYSSYPQRSADPAVYSTWANPAVSPNALGTWTTYDALGRPTQVQQNSELGLLTSTYEYLSGFQTRSTNPRGYQTTTSYLAYDQPTTDRPRVIAHPEGAYTNIFRDVFGKPTHLVRSNADNSEWNGRYYAYDPYQRLCKQSDLETGTTAFGYDDAGNLAWSAASLPWSTSEPCEYTTNHASVVPRRVDRSYDARNRLQTLSFPDGRGNQSWEYWSDGLAKKITTYNEVAQGGVVENSYAYNKRRLLASETQVQPDQPLWGMAYGYSTNAALASLTYPSGLSVNYAPNALGQPTQAGSYATGVSYFANGGMAQFTYGNGIVHTMIQNARQLPDQSVDSGGVLNDNYDYDANANVAAISDGLTGARGNRTMSYDGLDRLTATTSPMFPGGTLYEYDKLDNLTRVKAPGRDHYYCYDAHKWLTNVKTGSCSGTSVIGLGYDERGNLANKNGQLYQFDYGNRLRNVPSQENYRYDGYGRRISAQAAQGTIYSLYGQDGALRSQRDERKGEAYDYVTLNGSLVARVTDPNSVIGVPTLTVPASSGGNYTVQWMAVTAATRYELQQSFNGGVWQAAYSGTATGAAQSSQPAGSYGYRVRACKNTPCGGWSATATVVVGLPPAAAPVLTAPATAPQGNYTVSWSVVSGATSYVLDENVAGTWSEAYNGADLSQAYSAKPAGSYGYRVKACNTYGCSAVSAATTVQAIYPPVAPTLSSPASSYDGNYTVSWAAVSGATSYQLEESANGGAWTLVQNSAATSKAYASKADGSYSYRAKACNAAGCSGASTSVGIAVLTPPTAVPTITTPVNNYTGSYAVSWNGVPKATSYTLNMSVNGATPTTVYSGAGGSYNASGQGAGSYSYWVLACNGAGCSNWSASATTQVALVPAMPASLTGYTEPDPDLLGSRNFYVHWSAMPGATYYELTATGIGGGTYNITGTNYGASGKGTRSYSVRACNPAGCSASKGPLTL